MSNPLVRAAVPAVRSAKTAAGALGAKMGVPSVGARVRPAGDAFDDMLAELARDPSAPRHELGHDDLARLSVGSGLTPDLTATRGQPLAQATPEERAAVARQNAAIINAASAAITGGIGAITTAITSGSAERIAEIEAQARIAAARYLAEAQSAIAAGNRVAAEAAARRAADAAALQQLTSLRQTSGMPPNTMLIVGGVGAVGLILYLTTRGGARRNPAGAALLVANPVMVRARRGRKAQRKFVPAKVVGRARRRGWKIAR